MESKIVVTKRKASNNISAQEFAHIALHPGIDDWLKDKLLNNFLKLFESLPLIILSPLIIMVVPVPEVGILATYASIKKIMQDTVNILNAIIRESDYKGAADAELELFESEEFDEILVTCLAWSEDDLKESQVAWPRRSLLQPGTRFIYEKKYTDDDDTKHYDVQYAIKTADMVTGNYPFIFGARDSGWSNSVATTSSLIIKWRKPVKHRFSPNCLRYLFELIDPSCATVRCLRDFTSLVGEKAPTSLHNILKKTQTWGRIYCRPLTIFEQNLGLFPENLTIDVWGVSYPYRLYKATNYRAGVIPALENYLRKNQPDIACFPEFWVPYERSLLRNDLSDIYPNDNDFFHEGPIGDAPSRTKTEMLGIKPATYLDGGLLLLSRYPIIKKEQLIYDACLGEDCLVSKGVLYACIAVPSHPTPYDIFLTHMQSCQPEMPSLGILDEGPGDCWHKLRTAQVNQLYNFVIANRNPEHPCIMVGDFNQNGNKEDIYQGLLNGLGGPGLGKPIDLWKMLNPKEDGPLGITTKGGERIDYMFAWPSSRFLPLFNKAKIEKIFFLNSEHNSENISDHIGGLLCGFDALVEMR